jgi:hypothetical protein
LRQPEVGHQVTELLVGEALDDLPPQRLGQRLQGAVDTGAYINGH